MFTVQEEVGCRGSKPTAERIRPDIGIAVDITPAHDYPCDLEGSNTVGKGVAIKYADPSVICDEEVVAAMEECCECERIAWQPEVIDKGGTDEYVRCRSQGGRNRRRDQISPLPELCSLKG